MSEGRLCGHVRENSGDCGLFGALTELTPRWLVVVTGTWVPWQNLASPTQFVFGTICQTSEMGLRSGKREPKRSVWPSSTAWTRWSGFLVSSRGRATPVARRRRACGCRRR